MQCTLEANKEGSWDRGIGFQTKLTLVPILLLAFISGCVLFVSVRAIPLEWETSHPEAAVAYSAYTLAHGNALYPSVDLPPYTPVPYTPFFYWVLSIGGRAGLSIQGILVLGRCISLIGFVLLGVIVYRWTRWCGTTVLCSVVGVLWVLAEGDDFPWTVTARPDILAVVLSFAGLYLLQRSGKYWGTLAAGLVFALGILTKQSAIAAPVAAVLWLLLQREGLRVLLLSVGTILPVAGTLALLQRGQEHFFVNLQYLVHAGRNPDAARELLLTQFGVVNQHFAVLGLALMAVAGLKIARAKKHDLIVVYAVVAWFFALANISHVGSNKNYFIEPWAASTVLAVLGMDWLIKWVHEKNRRWLWVAVPLFFIASLATDVARAATLLRDDGLIRCSRFAHTVSGAMLLSDIPYLGVQSKAPAMLDGYFTTILESNGAWKPVPISDNIKSQRYDLIVVATNPSGIRAYRGYGFVSPSIAELLPSNYRFFCAFRVRDDLGELGYDTINVLVPKARNLPSNIESGLASVGCADGTKPPVPKHQRTFSILLQTQ